MENLKAMTLKEATEHNKQAFLSWWYAGEPEACDTLNNSNRELIKAYLVEYPNAKGYDAHKQQIVDLNPDCLENFCCTVIFDGNQETIKAISNSDDVLEKLAIAREANGIDLVWS